MKIMSKIGRILLCAIVVMLGVATPAWSQTIPTPMSPARLVNDYAGLFNTEQRSVLEDSLVAYDRATSTQIAVVTVGDLDGADAAIYATKLLTEWGVGRKGKDNGVVLLIKPRNQYGGGEVFIATGYGVEGALPDITAGQIIDRQMMPSLARGDYYTATERGTAAIRDALVGEYSATSDQGPEKVDWFGGIFSLMVMIFIFIAISKSYKNRGDDDSDGEQGGGSGRNFRRGVIMFPPILGGGFGGGGHGSGGFGGGGFGGFGGGMGGGGGAGRSF